MSSPGQMQTEDVLAFKTPEPTSSLLSPMVMPLPTTPAISENLVTSGLLMPPQEPHQLQFETSSTIEYIDSNPDAPTPRSTGVLPSEIFYPIEQMPVDIQQQPALAPPPQQIPALLPPPVDTNIDDLRELYGTHKGKYPLRNEWSIPRRMLYPYCMQSDKRQPRGCRGGFNNIPWNRRNGDTEYDFRFIKVPVLHEADEDQHYDDYISKSDDVKILLQLSRSRVRFAAGATLLTQYSPVVRTKHFFVYHGNDGIIPFIDRMDDGDISITVVQDYDDSLIDPNAHLLVKPTSVLMTETDRYDYFKEMLSLFRSNEVTHETQMVLTKTFLNWYNQCICRYNDVSNDYVNKTPLHDAERTLVPTIALPRVVDYLQNGVQSTSFHNAPMTICNLFTNCVLTSDALLATEEKDIFYTNDDVVLLQDRNAYCNIPFFIKDATSEDGIKPNAEYLRDASYTKEVSKSKGLLLAAVNHLRLSAILYFNTLLNMMFLMTAATNQINGTIGSHDPALYLDRVVDRGIRKFPISLISDYEHDMMCSIIVAVSNCKQQVIDLFYGDTGTGMDLVYVDLDEDTAAMDQNHALLYTMLVEHLVRYNDHIKREPKRQRTQLRKAHANTSKLRDTLRNRLRDTLKIYMHRVMHANVIPAERISQADDELLTGVDATIDKNTGDLYQMISTAPDFILKLRGMQGDAPGDPIDLQNAREMLYQHGELSQASAARLAQIPLNMANANKLASVCTKMINYLTNAMPAWILSQHEVLDAISNNYNVNQSQEVKTMMKWINDNEIVISATVEQILRAAADIQHATTGAAPTVRRMTTEEVGAATQHVFLQEAARMVGTPPFMQPTPSIVESGTMETGVEEEREQNE